MAHTDTTESLNQAPLSLYHFKTALITGMGYFTDAYDLFIIGAALALIQAEWAPRQYMIGLVGSIALLAAFFGALIFGRLADVWGRSRLYGLEAGLMTVGALVSAVAPNVTWLLIGRVLVGLGIGGDYPVSAVFMSEFANVRDRGKLVGMVFSMQALGLLVGPMVAMTLLAAGIPSHLAWRLMLGFGAVPAGAIIYFRRRMPESPRYRAQMEASALSARLTLGQVLSHPRLLRVLIGVAGTWFLFDYAYYGNSISLPLVLKAVAPHASHLADMAWSLIIFAVFALPGYIVAFLTIDRIGHRRLQWIGFLVMAGAFLAIRWVPVLTEWIPGFLAIFGVSYFFSEFGPNTTTFVLTAEVFPVHIRTSAHGIASGLAKFGAFIGVFLFPILEHRWGVRGTLMMTGLLSLAGLGLTFLLPEPAGRSLEEVGALTLQAPDEPPTPDSRRSLMP